MAADEGSARLLCATRDDLEQELAAGLAGGMHSGQLAKRLMERFGSSIHPLAAETQVVQPSRLDVEVGTLAIHAERNGKCEILIDGRKPLLSAIKVWCEWGGDRIWRAEFTEYIDPRVRRVADKETL
jgi:hypothetical protein